MNLETLQVSLEALESHRDFVRSLARQLVADPNDANDIEQETWLAALRTPPRREGPLRPWLARVARRSAFMRLRARGRRQHREQEAAQVESSSLDPVVELSEQRLVVEAVLALDEPYRSVVVQRYFRGHSCEELARLQSVPLETIRTRLRRAHSTLRKRLQKDFYEDGRDWHAALVGIASGGGSITAGPPLSAEAGGALSVGQVQGGGLASLLCVESALLVAGVLLVLGLQWPAAEATDGEPTLTPPALALVPAPSGASVADASNPEASSENLNLSTQSARVAVELTPQDLGSPERLAYWKAVADARAEVVRFDLAEHLTAEDIALGKRLREQSIEGILISNEHRLAGAARAVGELAGVPVRVQEACENTDVDRTLVFDLDLPMPMSVAHAFDLLADHAGNQVHWCVSDGAAVFYTTSTMQDRLVTFEHDVRDLLVDPRDYFEGHVDYFPIFDPLQTDDLMTLSIDAVEPGSWEEDGVVIEPVTGGFRVTQQPEVHVRIQDFLAQLRGFFAPLPEDGEPGMNGGQLNLRMDSSPAGSMRLFDELSSAPNPLRGADEIEFTDFVQGVHQVAHGLGLNLLWKAETGGHEVFSSAGISEAESAVQMLERFASNNAQADWTLQGGALKLSLADSHWGRRTELGLWDLRTILRWTENNECGLDVPPDVSVEVADNEDLTIHSLDDLNAFIRNNIAPESWDEDPNNRIQISSQSGLICQQRPRVLAMIGRLIHRLHGAAMDAMDASEGAETDR